MIDTNKHVWYFELQSMESNLPNPEKVRTVHKSINDCLKVDCRTMESIVRSG